MRAVSCVRTEFPFAFGQEPYPILGTEPLHSLSRPLGRDEPHIRPGNRFADRLRVRGIVLLPFNVGLYVGRRHQLHRVAERFELPRPMVRRGTGLYAHQARWQLLEER